MNHQQGENAMEKERFDEWFEAHFAGWLRAMRCGFRHDDIQYFRDSLLTAWNAAISSTSGRIREMTTEIEAAYREGYHQRGADEFGVSTKGSTPDVDFAWEHSEAKQGASIPSSRAAGEGQTIIDESELVALRCINDAVQIIGDQASETRNVNWAIVRDAKQRLRATKGAG